MNCKQCNAEYEEEYGYDGFCSESCQSDYDISHASDYRNALEIVKSNSLNPAHTMTKLGLQEVVDENYKLANKTLNALPAAEGKED